MGTFGYETPGGSKVTIENRIYGSKFTCPEDCTVDKLTASLEVTGGAHKTKCAIYDSSLNKVCESAEVTVPVQAQTWTDFAVAGSPALTGGAVYWLVVWSENVDTNNYFYYDDGDTDQMVRDLAPYNGWPDPLVPDRYDDRKASIYCTYTPVVVAEAYGYVV